MEDGEKWHHRGGRGGMFVPAGLFIGLGIGFIIQNVWAGALIGMGCGMLVSAIIGSFTGK